MILCFRQCDGAVADSSQFHTSPHLRAIGCQGAGGKSETDTVSNISWARLTTPARCAAVPNDVEKYPHQQVPLLEVAAECVPFVGGQAPPSPDRPRSRPGVFLRPGEVLERVGLSHCRADDLAECIRQTSRSKPSNATPVLQSGGDQLGGQIAVAGAGIGFAEAWPRSPQHTHRSCLSKLIRLIVAGGIYRSGQAVTSRGQLQAERRSDRAAGRVRGR